MAGYEIVVAAVAVLLTAVLVWSLRRPAAPAPVRIRIRERRRAR